MPQSLRLILKTLRSDVLSGSNLARLGVLAFYFVLIDSVQSYYLGRVLINQYVELDLLPSRFYSLGLTGFVLYFPIEFLFTFGTFILLWAVGSYMVWYYRNILRRR